MSSIETKDLIDQLDSANDHGDVHRRKGIDRIVFTIAGVLAIAFVLWGVLSPSNLGSVATALLNGTITNFGWLFVVAASIFTIFVIVVAVSRFGNIPLGQDGEKPQFKTSSWIAMMFATGMGIGLVFYGVGEPLFFYMSPPPNTVDPESAQAAATALGTTAFHWTLYPWAMYAIVGLGVAYGSFRLGRSQLFSALFAGLFGERVVYGVGGKIINILAILATLFGSACSLGLGALQIGGGIQSAGILESVKSPVLVVIIAVLTACFVASAVSGIEKGIQTLSNINMVLAVILALIVFIGGPTLFILNIIPTTLGAFIGQLPQMASRTGASGGQDVSDWLGSWTVFYWAWWVSWSPFVGLFIARISRGRTIRQFVTGVLLVPSTISILWFAIFGGGAIGLQQRAEAAGDASRKLVETADDVNFDLVLFDLLRDLPVPGWVHLVLMILTVVLIAIFFITGADSASIVMGGLSENGEENPKKWLIVFWGVATGAVAAVMLVAGGSDPAAALDGLKNITIVSALPFVIVMLLLCVSLWKDLSKDPLIIAGRLERQVLSESVAHAVEQHDGEVFQLHTTSDGPEVVEVTPVDVAAERVHTAAEGPRPDGSTPVGPTPIGTTPDGTVDGDDSHPTHRVDS